MNPEAMQHRKNVQKARSAYHRGEISLDDLYAVVDAYRAFMARRLGPRKAARFTRAYILRAL